MATQILAPSQVPQVIPFPAIPQQITQQQLENIVALRNRIALLKADLEASETEVQTAIEAGMTIEPGTHIAGLKESSRRNVAWREVAARLADRLYDGKGEGYCSNVLEHTKPSRTVSLFVS